MKFDIADCAHIGFIHLMTVENLKDCGEDFKKLKDNPDIWLRRFSDPRFFALVGSHGRKPVGIVTGFIEDSSDGRRATLDAFFLRRQWRWKVKPLKKMVLALNEFLTQNEIKKVEYEASEKNTNLLLKKGFVAGRIVMERKV